MIGFDATRNRNDTGKTRVAVLYPTGRFSVVQVARKKRGHVVTGVTRDEQQEMSDMLAPEGALFNGLCAERAPMLGLLAMARQGVQQEGDSRQALGSSIPAISHKRGKRGSGGITFKARDRITYAAAYLEWHYGRRNLSFLTLTVPDVTSEEMTRIQENWSEIVRQFVQSLKRKLLAKGVKTDVAGATEIQLGRLARTGLQAPHLHLLFRGRRSPGKPWAMSPKDFRALWVASIRRCAEVDIRTSCAVENVTRVKKSVSAYLGKYLSKKSSKDAGGESPQWHPTDWIVLSRQLRAAYRKGIRRCEGGAAVQFLDWVLETSPPGALWVRPIEVRTASGLLRLGWTGQARRLALSFVDFHSSVV